MSYSQLVSPIVEAIKQLYEGLQGQSKSIEKNDRKIAAIEARAKNDREKLRTLEAENAMMKSYLCKKDPSAPFCKP